MSRIATLAEEILIHLSALDQPLKSDLQPGITAAQLDDVQSKLAFELIEPLLDLYKWHNGTPRNDESELLPGWLFLSIETGLYHYQTIMDEESLSDIWGTKTFPILWSGAGDNYGVCCGTDDLSKEGEVICYRTGHTGRVVEFDSLESMLQTIIECFEQGAYYLDEEGDLAKDFSKAKQIARRLNPSLKR